jgi:hypothetical protein
MPLLLAISSRVCCDIAEILSSSNEYTASSPRNLGISGRSLGSGAEMSRPSCIASFRSSSAILSAGLDCLPGEFGGLRVPALDQRQLSPLTKSDAASTAEPHEPNIALAKASNCDLKLSRSSSASSMVSVDARCIVRGDNPPPSFFSSTPPSLLGLSIAIRWVSIKGGGVKEACVAFRSICLQAEVGTEYVQDLEISMISA